MLRRVVGDVALIEREIAEAISEALGRFGMAGEVRIGSDAAEAGEPCAVLQSYGPEVREPIPGLVERWNALGDEARRRQAQDLARRLATRRREVSAAPKSRSRLTWVGPVIGLFIVSGAAYAAYRYLAAAADAASKSAPPASSGRAATALGAAEEQRRARAARVCDAARARVVRGATLGPTDVEGWVVELQLLAPSPAPLGRSPSLSHLVVTDSETGRTRWIWPGAPALVALGRTSGNIELVDESYATKHAEPLEGLRFSMHKSYVDAFFREEQRGPFLGVAHAAAEELGARYAALYARCDSGKTHHMGTWFQGPSVAGASAALIYFMGTYASVSHVSLEKLGEADGPALDRPAVLQALEEAAARLTRNDVRTVIGEHGGMIAGRDPNPISLSFPFSDGNRASRASHALARAIGVGTEN